MKPFHVLLWTALAAPLAWCAPATDSNWDIVEVRTEVLKDAGIPPTVDGELGDIGWTDATVLNVQSSRNGSAHAEARMVECDGKLFLAFDVAGDPSELRAQAHKRDAPAALTDDAVEVVLDPGLSLARGYRVIVTAGNVVYDELLLDGGAKSRPEVDLSVASSVGRRANAWIVEMSIPMAELGLSGREDEFFGVNVALRRSGGERIPMVNTQRETDLFGLAVVGRGLRHESEEIRLEFKAARDAAKDAVALLTTLRNRNNEAEQYRMACHTFAPTGATADLRSYLAVDKRSTADVTLGPAPTGGAGEVLFVLTINNANQRRAERSVGFAAVAVRRRS